MQAHSSAHTVQPADVDLARTPTLGLQLVNILVRQLRADLAVTRENGVRIEFRFAEVRA